MTVRRISFSAAALLVCFFAASQRDAVHSPGAEAAAPFKLRKLSTYIDDVATYHLVGEVVNQTNKKLQRIEVKADFKNAAGKVIGTEYAYSCVDTLGPGDSSPFDIVVADPPAIASYKTAVTAYPATDDPVSGLIATAESPTVDQNKVTHVKGTVKNESTKTYHYVEVCGALMNPAKTKIIRAGFTFLAPSTLRPGASRSFDWELFDKLPRNLVPEIWVDGLAK